MNPNAARKGRSFKGAIAYIIHDPDQADTDERVLFTETRNLRTDDPEKAAKVMAYTAMHAKDLKAAAGLKATGRKADNPVYHLSLSWIPGEKPTQAEMMEAGQAALRALGFSEHEAVFAAHGDKQHLHLHVVVNRVHPVTGKSHNPNYDYDQLQAWGNDYDKARGMEWRSPSRAAKHEADPEKKQAYQQQAKTAKEKKGLDKTSHVRAAWEAANGASHPKSQRFQDLKALYAARAKELAIESRETRSRHKREWAAIKDRQAMERSALNKRQAAIRSPRNLFNQRSGAPDRVAILQKDYDALKISQRLAIREYNILSRQNSKLEVAAFLAKQRADRVAFARKERAAVCSEARNLDLASSTPVGQQNASHRGHLAKAFRRASVKSGAAVIFAAQQQEKKAAFYERLAARDRPQLEQMRAAQASERQALRDQIKAVSASLPSSAVSLRRDKTVQAAAHRAERASLREEQATERSALRGRWTALNEDRAQAWDGYRRHRAAQQGRAAEPSSRDRSAGQPFDRDIGHERSR
jgi:hypothetical protein